MDSSAEHGRAPVLSPVCGDPAVGGEGPPELLIPDETPYEQWQEFRRGRLGASDAGAILAWAEDWPAKHRPYGSALSCAHRIAGLSAYDGGPVEWGSRAPAEMGRLWEDGCWLAYLARMPHVIDQGKPGTFSLCGSDVVVATPDRLISDPTRPEGSQEGLCQIKIVFSTGAARWREDGEIRPPKYVVAQCVQEMAVMGRSFNDLAAFIDGTPHVWRIEWDPETWDAISRGIGDLLDVIENKRWHELIDGTQDASAAVTKQAAAEPSEDCMDLGDDWPERLRHLESLKDLKKQTEHDIREIETLLRYDLDGSEMGICDGWRISCREQERRTVDTKALKDKQPDVWREFMKTTRTRGAIRIRRDQDAAR